MQCPPTKSICVGLVIFVIGAVSLGGLNTFFHYTNRMEFCISCHTMKINYEEYKESVHYKNAAGIQATCADCHVPVEFFPKLYAKIMAAKDVYHEIAGTIDTPEKYEAHRWEMANRVWDKMRATDSRECRNCHSYDNMDLSAQDRMGRKKHTRAPLQGKTCIDCHAGIAHTEPDAPDEPDEQDIEGSGQGISLNNADLPAVSRRQHRAGRYG
ncbi:MAG TPA: cytochrome C [Gammaproteobacteria bacterium]|nr:cytochrome C [Gammaproteobacteria bacterium]